MVIERLIVGLFLGFVIMLPYFAGLQVLGAGYEFLLVLICIIWSFFICLVIRAC